MSTHRPLYGRCTVYPNLVKYINLVDDFSMGKYLHVGKQWYLVCTEHKLGVLWRVDLNLMKYNLLTKQRRGLMCQTKLYVLVHSITRGFADPKTVIKQSLSLTKNVLVHYITRGFAVPKTVIKQSLSLNPLLDPNFCWKKGLSIGKNSHDGQDQVLPNQPQQK